MHPTEKQGESRRAVVSLSSTGTLVAAAAGKRIRVLAIAFTVTTSAGTVALRSGASTAITGAFLFPAQGKLELQFNPCGWAETAVGESLDAVLATAGQVSGVVVYQLVG